MSKKNLVLGILAHVDAGKTTLSEAILYKTGTIRKLGRVDHKTAFLDNNVIEQDRGITVFSKEARFSIGEKDGVGSHSLLQGIFLTQGSNLGVLHCRQILQHLHHQ